LLAGCSGMSGLGGVSGLFDAGLEIGHLHTIFA
jgi:hypothetical protein